MPINCVLWKYLNKEIYHDDFVLDLCSGVGIPLYSLAANYIVAVDIYNPYLQGLRNHRKDIVSICWDVREIDKLFVSATGFDVIMCLDGVEHLEKEEAIKLIDWMEKNAQRKVIIFTPDGKTKNNPKDTWGIKGGDHYQKHLCGFMPDFFLNRGYRLVFRDQQKKASGKIHVNLYVKEIHNPKV